MTDENVVRSDGKGLPPDIAKKWEKRHIESELAAVLPKIEELADKNPGDYNLQILAARANYTYADGHVFLKMNEQN
ncbi:MAG: hypothetical protein NZL89_07375, partial [Leptospiraceae bacterium]|nr:hypothetical protein [Leptospiraceae bacterium]